MNYHWISLLKHISCKIFWVVLKLAVLVVVVTLISPAHSGLLLPSRFRVRLI